MADNSNLANSNNEPSMEDILSSIRKVIAEDLINEETASEEVAGNETIDTIEADKASETSEEFPNSEETFSPKNTNSEEIPTPDPLAGTAVDAVDTALTDTLVQDTDAEDILELDSIITELPDPLALTDELGEELELVSLEDDLFMGLAVNSTDDAKDTSKSDQEVELVDIFTDDATDPSPTEAATENDPVIAVNARVLAQTEADNDVGFDEALDLVMDSDASDYVTANLTGNLAADDLSSGEMEIEDWRERATKTDNSGDTYFEEIETDNFSTNSADTVTDTDTLELHADTDAELQAAVDKAVKTTLAEELITDEPNEQFGFEQEDLTPIDLHPNIDVPETEPTTATPDEDMDLVRSLLADLMDEPAPEDQEPLANETIDEPATLARENDTDITDFTNEILFREDPSPSRDNTLDEQDLRIPEPPDNADEIDPSNFENTLAQIAAGVGGDADNMAEDHTPNPDDIITLEDPGLASKLALGGGIASLAAVTLSDDADENTEPEPEPEPEPETETLSQDPDLQEPVSQDTVLQEPQSTETPQTSTHSIKQEEDQMATPMRTNSLSGSDTKEDVGNAFASLANAVQDKALAEENGPPIGELVKEALKPMLQDWLDKNLKAMVQRAVTKEIKRISSGK